MAPIITFTGRGPGPTVRLPARSPAADRTLVIFHAGFRGMHGGDSRGVCNEPIRDILKAGFGNVYEYVTPRLPGSYIPDSLERTKIDNGEAEFSSYNDPILKGNHFVLVGGDFNKDLPHIFRALVNQVCRRLTSADDAPVTITVPRFALYTMEPDIQYDDVEPDYKEKPSLRDYMLKGLMRSCSVGYGVDYREYYSILETAMMTFTGTRSGSSQDHPINLRVEQYFSGKLYPKLTEPKGRSLLTIRLVPNPDDFEASLALGQTVEEPPVEQVEQIEQPAAVRPDQAA